MNEYVLFTGFSIEIQTETNRRITDYSPFHKNGQRFYIADRGLKNPLREIILLRHTEEKFKKTES